MTINLDWVYKFRFKDAFEKFNGIYAVVKIYTYAELVTDQIDIFNTTYEPLEFNEADYEANELPLIRVSPIYKLVDVKNPDIIRYIPDFRITFAPDPNVKKYHNLTLAWNVGAFEDKEQLTAAQNTITELIQKLFGVSTPIIPLDIGVMWLTDSEYRDIENERENNKEKYVNWFSENTRLRAEVDKLHGIIAAQKNIIDQVKG